MDHWVLNRPLALWKTLLSPAGVSCPFLVRSFASTRTCVVLSRSNKPEMEVDLSFCRKSRIPVLQRRGGGGTVVLGNGCQILTIAFFATSLFSNEVYFDCLNRAWIAALKEVTGLELAQRGISDLAFGDRKIAGTSIFRRKQLLVFQGSLLVDADLNLISNCLRHPSREPDYRKNRSHLDFITNLKTLGVDITTQDLADRVQDFLLESLPLVLREHATSGFSILPDAMG